MMPANRLAVELADATGLRIGDVLALRTEQLLRAPRVTIREEKTGKTRRVYFPARLRARALNQAGSIYVFEGRNDPRTHRTRQAVNKDMARAAAVFKRSGIAPKASISPHSARKRAAVRAYHRGGVDAAKALLNHSDSDIAVTLLYALSDLERPPRQQRRRRLGSGAAATPRGLQSAAAKGRRSKDFQGRSR